MRPILKVMSFVSGGKKDMTRHQLVSEADSCHSGGQIVSAVCCGHWRRSEIQHSKGQRSVG